MASKIEERMEHLGRTKAIREEKLGREWSIWGEERRRGGERTPAWNLCQRSLESGVLHLCCFKFSIAVRLQFHFFSNFEIGSGMLSGGILQEDGGWNIKGASMSQETTFSGQTVSSSGSVALPARRGRPRRITPRTPNKQKSLLRLSHPAISEVCEKVQSKGRATYNEVSDELVAEYAHPSDGNASSDQIQYEEKNIQQRVYDALNTRPSATVEVEISENMQLVHFLFHIPFELHDDNYVLKQMERFQNSSSHGESALGETLWHAERSSVSEL